MNKEISESILQSGTGFMSPLTEKMEFLGDPQTNWNQERALLS